MDDIVAMQDAPISVIDASGASSNQAGIDAASTGGDELSCVALKMAAASQPSTPQQQQQQAGAGDASSVTSDSSGQEQSSKQLTARLGQATGNVDVHAAKQAALSALAGLDMTTTKANLDASKAAAATARANGEIPAHPRKSNLRSASCRQLGSSSTATSGTPTAVKSVAFDDTAKSRPPADGARAGQGQWRGPATTFTAADGQPRRANRAPASRCISLPHVLQGRAGMANRLAATYAQDAALQQQLQLLNGNAGLQTYNLHNLHQQLNHTTISHPADTLTVFQLQHQGLASSAPSQLLAQQRSFGAATAGTGLTMDDSMLPLQSGSLIMQSTQQQQQRYQQQQLQQQQLQQARLAQGNWVPAAAAGAPGQPTLTRWGSGQLTQQSLQQPNAAALAQAQAVNSNAQLLAQLQATSQGQQGGEALWVAAPASAGLQLTSRHPQGVVLQPQAAVSGGMSMAGIPNLQHQQLMAAQLQPSAAAGAAGTAGGVSAVNGNALVESYQSASWSVLSAAQGEVALRDQLLTELVLLLTMLHTLDNTLKGSMTPQDAMNDFSYLAAAARRHMATFSRLSQAGNIAVQLVALTTPLALKHVNSTDLIEAAFIALETLALANRDVANVVTQQRLNALTSVGLQLPVEHLLQQQQQALQWITSLGAAVGRNKAVLEAMAGDTGSQGPAVGSTAGLVQNANLSGGGLLPAGMGISVSQPMMLGQQQAGPPSSISSSTTLSPTRKTPLATYFEEASQPHAGAAGAAAGGLGAVGGGLGAAAGGAPGVRLGAGTPPGSRLGESLMVDALGGMNLVAAPAAMQDDAALAAGAAGGQLGINDIDKLAGLSLGVSLGQLQGAAQPGAAGQAVAGTGSYSPLGGGLSLFGEAHLLMPGGGNTSSGPGSTGATNLAAAVL